MSEYLMQCWGLVGESLTDDAPDVTGCFLAFFDPEFAGGRGMAEWTPDPETAIHFATAMDVFRMWNRVSALRPVRDDGQPNKPLTAYTVEAVPLADAY